MIRKLGVSSKYVEDKIGSRSVMVSSCRYEGIHSGREKRGEGREWEENRGEEGWGGESEGRKEWIDR
jgi:hypothetical protein